MKPAPTTAHGVGALSWTAAWSAKEKMTLDVVAMATRPASARVQAMAGSKAVSTAVSPAPAVYAMSNGTVSSARSCPMAADGGMHRTTVATDVQKATVMGDTCGWIAE
ncbi:hypothetical protein HPB48_018737 [Haemaphysalis longicornis]|uniref:Uncharacterized protein n=1 Tax=Haemaphysalis longicornis TaxID=44386 RepID=A0A9J6GN27_HAELO|nr:hypothetical protein HPB48_018737 [Haemaphysalis longicornis]